MNLLAFAHAHPLAAGLAAIVSLSVAGLLCMLHPNAVVDHDPERHGPLEDPPWHPRILPDEPAATREIQALAADARREDAI